MPAIQRLILAGAALAPLLLGGCTTSLVEPTMAGFAPASAGAVAVAAADDVSLPEMVEASPTPRAPEPELKRVALKQDAVQPAEDGNMLVALGIAEPPRKSAALAKAERLTSSRREIDALIAKYADVYELPVDFVHKVVKRESTYNPKAFNKGHWGLMQIKHATARGMGYDGPANGLLDPDTNLKYALKYLKGAYMVADGNEKLADRMYQRGYYYDAKRRGLLDETGLGRDRVRKRGV